MITTNSADPVVAEQQTLRRATLRKQTICLWWRQWSPTRIGFVPFAIEIPRLVRFGGGALAAIGEVLQTLGVRRPLVVSDGYLASSGGVDRLVALLHEAGQDVAVFTDTVADPTSTSLLPAQAALTRHGADAVIGFGGGSPIDTAKALAVLAVNDEPIGHFRAPRRFAGPALPVIAVPTTAGSGSEATQFTIITDTASDEKMLCVGRSFLPTAAIVDFELTLTMPARLTADTGVDALTHAVEAYVSRKANAFTDPLCLSAIRGISQNLRRVYRDGGDRDARETMMVSATQAGIAFSNSSVALIHGMSRPIGAHFHVAHGLSNAMLFPVVTRFSVDSALERYADCAVAMGLASEHDPNSLAAVKFVDAIEVLCQDLAVPTPAQYGIPRSEWERLIPVMADQALASGSPANNPLIPDAAQIAELYGLVYS